MQSIKGLACLLGRIFLGVLFLWAASTKIMDWGGTVHYMASKKMPFIAFFLPAAVVMQIIGGISLILGYKVRYGALILIIFILPACIIFHDFWNLSGYERLMEQIIFMKDIGVLGGLLQIAAFGPGPFALEKEPFEKDIRPSNFKKI